MKFQQPAPPFLLVQDRVGNRAHNLTQQAAVRKNKGLHPLTELQAPQEAVVSLFAHMLSLLPSPASIPQPLTRRGGKKPNPQNKTGRHQVVLLPPETKILADHTHGQCLTVLLSSRARFQLDTQQLRYLLPHRSPHCFTGQVTVDLKSLMSCISEHNYTWGLIPALCFVCACCQAPFI